MDKDLQLYPPDLLLVLLSLRRERLPRTRNSGVLLRPDPIEVVARRRKVMPRTRGDEVRAL